MNWLISITAGRWQRYAIQQAKEVGLNVLAIDSNPNAEGFMDADISICIDIFNVEGIISKITELGIKPAGVCCFTSEAGMQTAALLREYYDLKGLRKIDTDKFIYKNYQREIWDRSNVEGPRWFTASTSEDVIDLINTIKLPAIIKPVDSAGSRGISKITESNHETLQNLFNVAHENSRTGQVIVEEFMEGTEYTAEVLAYNGTINVLALTSKKKVADTDDTVANELATPDIPDDQIKLIEATTIKAFKALNLSDGPGHAELILGQDRKPKMVEAAGRGGGLMVFDKLVPTISGVNIAQATSLQACNKPVENLIAHQFSEMRAAVLRFISFEPGTVKAIEGFEDVNQINNVEAGCLVSIGNVMSKASTDGDRMAYILTNASNIDEAQRLADVSENMISIEVTYN